MQYIEINAWRWLGLTETASKAHSHGTGEPKPSSVGRKGGREEGVELGGVTSNLDKMLRGKVVILIEERNQILT